jgi:hypothetical protein
LLQIAATSGATGAGEKAVAGKASAEAAKKLEESK